MSDDTPTNPERTHPLDEPAEFGEGRTLTEIQEQAIGALLSQPTVAKAAEAVNVAERTIYRWMRDPAFLREYRRARREAFAQAIGVTQRFAPLAVATLAQIMSDPKAGNAARVSAASMILKFSRESLELDDLAERIEALEETTAQAKALLEQNQQQHEAPKSKAWAA